MQLYGVCITIDGSKTVINDRGKQAFRPTGLSDIDQANYEQQVHDIIAAFSKTSTGSCLLAQLAGSITVHPQSRDMLYAGSMPLNWVNATAKGILPGITEYNVSTDTFATQQMARSVGTGKGSDSMVFFTPSIYTVDHGPGSLGDEVLLHEMVHALRETMGMHHGILTVHNPVDKCYDNDEEFYAILVANIYMSEKTKNCQRLCANHHPLRVGSKVEMSNLLFTGRVDDFADPKIFYREYRDDLRDFCKEMSSFTLSLADVSAPFNPLRELYDNPENNDLPHGWRQKPGQAPTDPAMWQDDLGHPYGL